MIVTLQLITSELLNLSRKTKESTAKIESNFVSIFSTGKFQIVIPKS